MANISKVAVNGQNYDIADNYCRSLGNGKLFYGTCASAGSATAKVVTCPAFTANDLTDGTVIVVKFNETNSGAVASLTLNVNGTGAKGIRKQTSNSVGNLGAVGRIQAKYVYRFIYANSFWVMDCDENSTYSAISDANIKSGTNTTAGLITGQRFKSGLMYYCNGEYHSSSETLELNFPV